MTPLRASTMISATGFAVGLAAFFRLTPLAAAGRVVRRAVLARLH
jgi:hypothetical protein